MLKLLNPKLLSIAAGTIILLLVATYFYGYTKGESKANTEWEVKIATAPVQRDTVIETKYIELPPHTDTVYAVPKKVTRTYQARIDSAIAASDSLEQMIAELLWVQTSWCEDSILGTVTTTYYPFEKEFVCAWNPNPLPVREVIITETKEILKERAWYEVPAYIVGGVVGGWLIGSELKK